VPALLVAGLLGSASCGDERGDQLTSTTMFDDDTGGMSSGGDGDGDGDDAADSGDGGIKLDVSGGESGGGPGNLCKVDDGQEDAGGTCDDKAPPNSFDPDLQWEWLGPNGEVQCTVTPVVMNLTDDNDDGEIDLCDVPDVLVIAYAHLLGLGSDGQGYLYALDGKTGAQHFRIDHPVWQFVNPAAGDIDNDGLPEIIAADHATKNLIAFEHDGTLKWIGNAKWSGTLVGGAISLADLDNDGDVEIYTGDHISDHEGNLIFTFPPELKQRIPTAADLDDDGDLEISTGRAAFHHDGTVMWSHPEIGGSWGSAGFSQVADVDLDGKPEIVVTHDAGIHVLEHDGAIKQADAQPVPGGSGNDWARPAAMHDIDGDGQVEMTMSTRDDYAAIDFGPVALKWAKPVLDQTGVAGGTAFDFLGDGVAEAMYADETQLFVFDGQTGQTELQWPRFSRTNTEYPVVADVDNDGSAEIVVVSNEGLAEQPPGSYPTVIVVRDAADRWIQPRRIWNQHTYHVTNVREDGTIPQFEEPNWETFNTYRTQAQINPGGQACIPPEG
jgi:outer membrane protein assembly factor BamB